MARKSTSASQPIPEFKLIEKLGQGGMGSVFKALQISLDREVALKIMPARLADNPEFKERFFREARAAGKLNHTHIVQGIDAGETGGYCWIAMELVKGGAVSALLAEKGKLGRDESLDIILQIAKGLEHASKAGIVHRDVKPENFLLSEDGVAKLCDLGISKVATDASLTQTGHTLGTPHYISPEQARGQQDIDSRADIYSLGASWYHLLSAKTPFEGPTAAVIMTKHITEKPKPITTLVENIDKNTVIVIEKMMAKKKEDRYQDIASLIEDLEAIKIGGLPKHALPLAEKRMSPRTRKVRSKRVQSGAHKSVGKSAKGKSKKGIYVGIGAGVLLLLIIFLAGSGSEEKVEYSPEPQQKKMPVRQSSIKKESSPERKAHKRPRRYSENAQEISRSIAKSAEEGSGRDVSKTAEEAYKKLLAELDGLPDAARIEYLKQFAEKYKNSPWGKKAYESAVAKGTELAKSEKESMEKSAMVAKNRLPDITEEGAVAAYEGFLRDYPGSRAAKIVQEELDRYLHKGDDRFRYAVIPQDDEAALQTLRDIAQGETNAETKDVLPFLKHRKSDIRRTALMALESTDRGDFFKKSLELLGDRNEKVRVAAVRNLRPFVDEEKVRKQVEKVARTDPSRMVRENAQRILNGR